MMKRKSLLKFLGATLAICVVSGAAVGVNNALTAKAAEYPTDAKFVMEQKASVRTADPTGIRFRVEMDATMRDYIVNNEDVGYGFLIFQQKDLGTITDDYHNAITKKVDITGDESKIYKVGESYWANGALTNIHTENFTKEFTCVAYTKNGTTYNYADLLDVEFSRSVYSVASAAYINEPNLRGNLTTTYAELGTTKPILIDSYENLVKLSTEVQDGEKFENVNFKLGTNITLEDGYTAIPDTFAGMIDFGDYSVIAPQGETISVNASIVNNAKYVEVVENTPYLMIVDSTNRSNYKGGTTSMTYTSATDLTALTGVTGEYSGNAANVTGKDDLKGTVALGWTGAQLQALKQSGYNSVTFTFLAYHSSNAGKKLYTAVKNFEVVGQMAPWKLGQWYSVAVNIDDVAAAMADNTLTLFDDITRTGVMITFYFGDIALSKATASDMTTLWDVSESYTSLKNVSSWTESEKITAVSANNTGKYDETLARSYVDYNGNTNATNAILLQLDYTVEQLALLKEKGYTGITTTLYISAATSNTSGTLTFNSDLFGTQYFIGVGKTEEGKTAYNTAVTLTATIDGLIDSMNKFDQTLGPDKTLNHLWLGKIEDRMGASALDICFSDFVLTKAE